MKHKPEWNNDTILAISKESLIDAKPFAVKQIADSFLKWNAIFDVTLDDIFVRFLAASDSEVNDLLHKPGILCPDAFATHFKRYTAEIWNLCQ